MYVDYFSINWEKNKTKQEGILASFTHDSSTQAAGVFLDLPGGDADAYKLVALRTLT